jgi:hypothetical protein
MSYIKRGIERMARTYGGLSVVWFFLLLDRWRDLALKVNYVSFVQLMETE